MPADWWSSLVISSRLQCLETEVEDFNSRVADLNSDLISKNMNQVKRATWQQHSHHGTAGYYCNTSKQIWYSWIRKPKTQEQCGRDNCIQFKTNTSSWSYQSPITTVSLLAVLRLVTVQNLFTALLFLLWIQLWFTNIWITSEPARCSTTFPSENERVRAHARVCVCVLLSIWMDEMRLIYSVYIFKSTFVLNHCSFIFAQY